MIERQKKVAFRLVNARLAGAFDGWRSSAQRRKVGRCRLTLWNPC